MGICESAYSGLVGAKKAPELPSEPLTRSIGSIRESFIMIRNLGSGSFGSVFLVKDKRSGLERAAKELIKSLINLDALEQFCIHLNALKNLVKPK
jgi:serine/threonine protein kinase